MLKVVGLGVISTHHVWQVNQVRIEAGETERLPLVVARSRSCRGVPAGVIKEQDCGVMYIHLPKLRKPDRKEFEPQSTDIRFTKQKIDVFR